MPYKDPKTAEARESHRKAKRRWREKNLEKVREDDRKLKRKWREKNPEKAADAFKRWHEKWLKENPARVKVHSRASYERHREKYLVARRRHYEANKKETLAREKMMRAKDPKKYRARVSRSYWKGREDLRKLYEAIKVVKKKLKAMQ